MSTKTSKTTKNNKKPAKAAQPAKKPAVKAKAKKTTKPARIDTGYCNMIRTLLHKEKHTVSEAAALIKAEYPDKTDQQIKRVMANVAKRERKATQNFDLKWVSSAVTGTGYMARIDELLREEKLTTRQVGDKVAVEFDKPVESAKKVIRARLKRLRKKGETINVPLESDLREEELAKNPKPAKKDNPKKSKEIGKAKKAADKNRGGAGAKAEAAVKASMKAKPAKARKTTFKDADTTVETN